MFIVLSRTISFALFIVFAPLTCFSFQCNTTLTAREAPKYLTQQGNVRQFHHQGKMKCKYTILAAISNSVITFKFEGFTMPDKHYIKVYHDDFKLLYSFSNKTRPSGYYEYHYKKVSIIFEVAEDAENSYFNFTMAYHMASLANSCLKLDASKSWNSATTFPIGKAVNKITLFQIIADFKEQTILKIKMSIDFCHRFINNNRFHFYMGDRIDRRNKVKLRPCNKVGRYEFNILSFNAIVVFNHYANESSSHLDIIFSYASFLINIDETMATKSWQSLASPNMPTTFDNNTIIFNRIVANDSKTKTLMFKIEHCRFVDGGHGPSVIFLFFKSNVLTPANIRKRFNCHDPMKLPYRFNIYSHDAFVIFESFAQWSHKNHYKFAFASKN